MSESVQRTEQTRAERLGWAQDWRRIEIGELVAGSLHNPSSSLRQEFLGMLGPAQADDLEHCDTPSSGISKGPLAVDDTRAAEIGRPATAVDEYTAVQRGSFK